MRIFSTKGKVPRTSSRLHILGILTAIIVMAAVLKPRAAFAGVIKCYTIGTENTAVYSNSNLSGNKYGTIWATDELIVNSVSSNGEATNVTYPISGGRTKTGWIRTRAIVVSNEGDVHKSTKRYVTYKRPNGAQYGSVYVGDSVLVLGTSGRYTQIRYPVGGGWYKIGWAYTSDVNAGMSSSSSPSPSMTVRVQQRLDSIANGSLRYDSKTNMRLNTKFTGTRAVNQCKGFAQNVFYLCFKITPNTTQNKPNNYLLNSRSGMTRVGYYSNISTSQAKSLFSKARPGDFVQMRRRSSGGSHSAIVYSVGPNGITFFEANTDGRNTVKRQYYAWAQLSSKNRGMSLYTASNYSLR